MKLKTIFLFLLLSLIIYYLWPRSEKDLLDEAVYALQLTAGNDLMDKLDGPLIYKHKDFTTFVWFKPLEWGDSSKIFISVYHNFYACFEENDFWLAKLSCYYSPYVTTNLQWYYFVFEDRYSNFYDVFPSGLNEIKIKTGAIHDIQDESVEYSLIYSEELIIQFLKGGWFNLIEVRNDSTFICFYQPIANFYPNKISKDTLETSCAVVVSNGILGTTLSPYPLLYLYKDDPSDNQL